MFGMFKMTDEQYYTLLVCLVFVLLTFGGAFIEWLWPLGVTK